MQASCFSGVYKRLCSTGPFMAYSNIKVLCIHALFRHALSRHSLDLSFIFCYNRINYNIPTSMIIDLTTYCPSLSSLLATLLLVWFCKKTMQWCYGSNTSNNYDRICFIPPADHSPPSKRPRLHPLDQALLQAPAQNRRHTRPPASPLTPKKLTFLPTIPENALTH